MKEGKPYKLFFDFDNWTQRYSLYCDYSSIRTNCKTMLLVISTFICFIFLSSADICGRRTIMRMASTVVIIGIVTAYLSPSFFWKMVGLGLVSGGEGAFSALFTIYINENSTKGSKLRSSLVSTCFLAFSIGCIVFNLIAYITTNPDALALIAATSTIFTVAFNFFGLYETPYYLYRKGRMTDLFDTLMGICHENLGKGMDDSLYIGVEDRILELMGFKSEASIKAFFKDTRVDLIRTKKEEGPKGSNAFMKILKDWALTYHLVSLVCTGGLLYCLFYGMSINISELGLSDIKLNGILLGATQAIGYIGVIPFLHNMKRKRWTLIFEGSIMAGAVMLFSLSRMMDQTDAVRLSQTLISTCIMASVMSALYPIFFIYISEVFPTEVRGTANAIILLLAKLIGSSAPLFEYYSVNNGVHVLVGCSLLVLIALPITCGNRETLERKKS